MHTHHLTPRALTLSGAVLKEEGIPPLEVVSLKGREAINALFEYTLVVQTPEHEPGRPRWEVDNKALLGREITVHLELEGAGTFATGALGNAGRSGKGAGVREISGVVAAVRYLDADARHLRLELILRPGVWEATLCSHHHAFHDMTVIEILDAVLEQHPWPVDKRLSETYPTMDRITQWGESDWRFCCRLMQQCGINHHFEHAGGTHRLVLSDCNAAFTPFGDEDGPYHRIPIHPPGHRLDREYIHAFVTTRLMVSTSWEARDHDYTRPRTEMRARQGETVAEHSHPRREVYQWRVAGGATGALWSQPNAGRDSESNAVSSEHAVWLARIRHQELTQTSERGQGEGHIRGIVPGRTFHLEGHQHSEVNAEHIVLGAELSVHAPGQESQSPLAQGQWLIETRFTTQPARAMLRPALTLAKPSVAGAEPGIVVGPEEGQVHTDHLGRVKVWQPWQRTQAQDATSSPWLRVSHPWAGNQQGAALLPRVGQEVMVGYYGGDPDLPVVFGSVHNGLNLPGWQLPGQHVLTGLRSRELGDGGGNRASGRGNHMLLDDTPGHIQAQIKSDHQHSSLSLGDIYRVEDREGRKDARGQGAELRTDGHAVVRAAKGLLVTTEPREAARAHILESAETQARLQEATEQHERLAVWAMENQAQDAGDQDGVHEHAQLQQKQVAGSGKALGELTQPHVVISSAAGIASTATGSTHQASNVHHAITSGAHTSVSAGGSLLVAARHAVRMFAGKLGMRLIAAAGDIDIRALSQSVHLLARLEITETAEVIRISATKQLEVSGGGSYGRWNAGGIEFGSSGPLVMRVPKLVRSGAHNIPLPQLAVHTLSDINPRERMVVRLSSHAQAGFARGNEPYELLRNGQSVAKGITNAQGQIELTGPFDGVSKYEVRTSDGHVWGLPLVEGMKSQDQRYAEAGLRDAAGAAVARREHAQRLHYETGEPQ